MLRLVAVIIDGLIGIAFVLPIYWYFHVWEDVKAGVQPPLRVKALIWIVGFATFVAINYRLLEKRGQTIGKCCMSVAIVDLDGANIGAARIITYRFVPAAVVSLAPIIGPLFSLADILAIFGEQRRCIHDRIAGTKVIDLARD